MLCTELGNPLEKKWAKYFHKVIRVNTINSQTKFKATYFRFWNSAIRNHVTCFPSSNIDLLLPFS